MSSTRQTRDTDAALEGIEHEKAEKRRVQVIEHSIRHSIEQYIECSMRHSIERSIERSTERSIEHFIERSIKRSIEPFTVSNRAVEQ